MWPIAFLLLASAYEFLKIPELLLCSLCSIHYESSQRLFLILFFTALLSIRYENTPYKLYSIGIISITLSIWSAGEPEHWPSCIEKTLIAIILCAKYGPEFMILKKLTKKEIDVLSSTYTAWEQSANHIKTDEVYWVSIYAEDNPYLAELNTDRMVEFVRHLSSRILEFEHMKLDGYGFIINPPGSKDQDWHIDYTKSYTTVFVPMINCSSKNCTQLMTDNYFTNLFHTQLHIIETNITMSKPLLTRQIITPEYVPIILSRGLFHRGITNSDKKSRVIFWLSYKDQSDKIIPEKSTQPFSKETIDLHY
jgi:hypothetical protein